ncbi:MAG: type II toxin-antitoxin system HicA family toxin [Nostoc sp.]|uniref:type II toxin-antitoxin system HicA family toxin n=1 Tax=Nostoc sp. TaxID=1180 RepID=UPI002FF856EF
MSVSFTPEVKKLLTEAGCYFKRQGKGDHEIWYSPITDNSGSTDTFMQNRVENP